MDLDGLRLRYSTAQPFCRMVSGRTVLYVFFAIPGISPEFSFAPEAFTSKPVNRGIKSESSNHILVSGIEPSTSVVVEADLPNGRRLQVVVLTRKQARSATGISLGDGDHFVLSSQEVYSDGRSMTSAHLCNPISISLFGLPCLPLREAVFVSTPSRMMASLRPIALWAYRGQFVHPWTPGQFSLSDLATVPTANEN